MLKIFLRSTVIQYAAFEQNSVDPVMLLCNCKAWFNIVHKKLGSVSVSG